jgi:hypothetical protein
MRQQAAAVAPLVNAKVAAFVAGNGSEDEEPEEDEDSAEEDEDAEMGDGKQANVDDSPADKFMKTAKPQGGGKIGKSREARTAKKAAMAIKKAAKEARKQQMKGGANAGNDGSS